MPFGMPAGRERHHRAQRPATIQDWLAIPEEQRAELIQGNLFACVRLYGRRGDGSGGSSAESAPGGWWISQEVDMEIGPIGCRPDIVGWRRDRHPRCPEPDARGVVTAAPDFVCEVLSQSTARYDQGEKLEAYFAAGVAHYWLADPTNKTLTILTRTELGYVVSRTAGPGETVRAAPFEKVGVAVAELFMDDDEAAPATSVPTKAKATPTVRRTPASGKERAAKGRVASKKTRRR
jgi:Uma2 family endonuclease